MQIVAMLGGVTISDQLGDMINSVFFLPLFVCFLDGQFAKLLFNIL